MDLQDKIYVEHYRYPQVHEIIHSSTFKFFKTDKYYENYTEINENESWTLTFEGNPNDKLYIDGLSLLKDENIQKDENDKYYISPDIKKNRTIIQLYNPSENDTDEVSGYLPGNFLLKLVTFNNEIYYSWLRVNPKFVDKNELESMRNEIDELVQELSLDHYRSGNFGSYYLSNSILTKSDFETLSILHSYKEEFLSNYQELLNDPKKRIKLSYTWANKETGSLDQISIKEMTKHPEKSNQVFGKIRTVTPDIIENTDLKKNFIFLEKRITKLIKHINIELNNKFNQNVSLKEDKQIAQLYLSLIRYALNQKWLKEISADFLLYDNVLTLDHRYLFFRKLVWNIKHISYHKPKFLRQYNYYWKRTELLYELWGYLKVIKAMRNIGFSTNSGWFFDSYIKENQFELKDGTTVNMTLNKPNLEILHAKIIYNKKIKGTSQNNVEKDDPIWCSSNHNKPDIRINIYDSEMTLVYIIVLDSKYRKLDSCIRSKSNWSQLNDYSTSLFSEYPYKSDRYKERRNSIETTKPIDTATFILYPQEKDESSKNQYSGRLADGRIQAIGLRPKNKSHKLEEKLESCINKIENWI